MRKLVYVFLLVCIFVFGMTLGKSEPRSESGRIQERIEEFEKEIQTPGNRYSPREKIDPNLANEIAKTGENLITKGFDYLLEAINSLIQK
ncbi:MAG: hypothetical protein WBK54_04450 [Bacilli bacterium]|jgi:hypothetical protein